MNLPSTIPHVIGRVYKYPLSKKRFVLKEVRGWVFKFECDWVVSDNVFTDMIDTVTGLAFWEHEQLDLFINA